MTASEGAATDPIYQLKVTLKGSRPPIWRRFQVAADISLHELHLILQVVIGWSNYHLYRFEVAGRQFGEPDPESEFHGLKVVNSKSARLGRVAPSEKTRFVYEYDFGDSWRHEILVERILQAEPATRYPICLGGKRACPPEDCGGVRGYAHLLEVIQDPAHEEHEQMMEWLGGEFDPDEFRLDEVNQALRAYVHGSARGKRKIGRNEPCPCGSGKKYKKCCGMAMEAAPPPHGRTIRRLMERDLRALRQVVEKHDFESPEEAEASLRRVSPGGEIPEWTPETPLEQAQELVYQALEATGKRERIRLAMEALKVCQDCADAYVLLAEEAAETLEQARNWYQRGVEAGERALGADVFATEVGRFWGLVETRPYMRAREGLAHCLWELGERQAAVEHCQDMLRLNPGDNQGIRYILLAWLMQLGRLDQAEKLLAEYQDEETAAWLFTRALLLFLRQGDSQKARQALKEAIAGNKHVTPYLLGQRRMPRDYPSSVEIGGPSEAVEYVALYHTVWAKSPGALGWLATQVRRRPASAAQSEHAATGGQLALPLGNLASPQPMAPVEGVVQEAAPTRQEWRRLYEMAVSFKELAPWEWLDDSDLFGVQNPETGEVGYCSIMGSLGEVLALGVFLGPDGFEGYRRMVEGEVKHNDPKAITLMRCLVASFEDRSSLDEGDLAVIRELGLQFRGRHAWPQFRSYRPGYAPWYVTGPEARFLATALEQAMDVAVRVRRGLDLFQGVDEDLVLVREWHQATRKWQDAWRPLPLAAPGQQAPAVPDERRMHGLREKLGVPQGTWQVDFFPIPGLIQEPGRRPYYPRAWLCVEQESGLIIGVAVLESWRSPEECQEAFISILEKARCLAAVVQVSKEAKELLAPLAQSLGIVVQERRRLTALERAKRSMTSFLRRR